jgi:hypothetical protein
MVIPPQLRKTYSYSEFQTIILCHLLEYTPIAPLDFFAFFSYAVLSNKHKQSFVEQAEQMVALQRLEIHFQTSRRRQ